MKKIKKMKKSPNFKVGKRTYWRWEWGWIHMTRKIKNLTISTYPNGTIRSPRPRHTFKNPEKLQTKLTTKAKKIR